ncbi:MAG TPA: hypothetical protein VE397_14050, partial [Stellaceae bacterium]|nr:hypothetical protein [Stellaceae bacterium]
MVSSINSTSASSATTSQQSQFQQIQSDINTLKQSLQSGNLTAAQQAFGALQQDAPQGGNNPL